MGFPRRRSYVLQFREGDPITDGLEVKATAPTLIESLEFREGRRDGETDREFVDRQYDILVQHIVEWNIEDEDEKPLPITLDSWHTIDLPVQRRIVDAWFDIDKLIDESSPLDEASDRGSATGSTTGRDPVIEASIQSQALP